ncbi:3'(2'),5'-bisphosphate nucleotidase CysQ family protein [Prochlorococcus marinus]|uniref:3'(2'),5'-bisphosphate nucleotidase CysQ family protein n=1 Tax=Prochlorococcus marinus TaxID=1219 RepID=UPI0022B5BFA3|nr:3'(2'),5'-bisphosphate nucleotidase CysQ [Prochlorococcus marinus]
MSIDLVLPKDVELENLLDGLRQLCWASADVLKAYARGEDPPYGYPKCLTVEEGGDGPVSAADMAVNNLLISGLKKKFPSVDWNILSEETVKDQKKENLQINDGWQWIIDPLDGTKDFLQGSQNYAVHLALALKKKPILGIVLIPERDELWFGFLGFGAWYENRDGIKKSVSFSDRNEIFQLILVSSKNHKNALLSNLLRAMEFGKTKNIGSVGCKVASILRGEADVYISLSGKTSPKDWDMAAPHALIEAAGGMFSHADGKNLIYQETNYSQSGCLIASHGKSHQKICQKAMDFFSLEEPKYFV